MAVQVAKHVLAATMLLTSIAVSALPQAADPNNHVLTQALAYPRAAATPGSRTSIWTTTSSTRGPHAPIMFPGVTTEWLTTATLTLIEPTGITDLPATVIQTVYIDRTIIARQTVSNGNSYSVWQSTGTEKGTAKSTWVLYPPKPTHLPQGTKLPCKECNGYEAAHISEVDKGKEPASGNAVGSVKNNSGDIKVERAPSDPRCDALGLATGCMGQCTMRDDGNWWCRRMKYVDVGTEAQMGRACWGNHTLFAQLVEPCIKGDHAFECVPCRGRDVHYAPVDWIQV